jgi:hypothetical protein
MSRSTPSINRSRNWRSKIPRKPPPRMNFRNHPKISTSRSRHWEEKNPSLRKNSNKQPPHLKSKLNHSTKNSRNPLKITNHKMKKSHNSKSSPRPSSPSSRAWRNRSLRLKNKNSQLRTS